MIYVAPINIPIKAEIISTKEVTFINEAKNHIVVTKHPNIATGIGSAKTVNKDIIKIFFFIKQHPFYKIRQSYYVRINSEQKTFCS